jgi:hypothetical protein
MHGAICSVTLCSVYCLKFALIWPKKELIVNPVSNDTAIQGVMFFLAAVRPLSTLVAFKRALKTNQSHDFDSIQS